MRTNRRGAFARIPCSRTSSAPVFSDHSCPRAFSSAVMRGLPYRPFTSAGISSLAPARSRRHASVGLSARPAQA